MGDFGKIVEDIAGELNDKMDQGINQKDIRDIVDNFVGGPVNCYPGIPGDICYDKAIFFSLTSKRYIKKRKDSISFVSAVTSLIKHMQGSCTEKTNHAILITDNWDANVYEDWRLNLEEINKNIHLEIYLLTSKSCAEINLTRNSYV